MFGQRHLTKTYQRNVEMFQQWQIKKSNKSKNKSAKIKINNEIHNH